MPRIQSSPVWGLVLSATVLAGTLCQPALAQTARSGGGGAQNAQLVQQLQQLASERTAMQAEQAKMKKELEDLRKERDALKAGQVATTQRSRAEADVAIARSTRDREAAEKELSQVKQRTQELVDKFRETAQALREVETDRATAKQALARQGQELEACVANNDALYKLNDEVLTRFEQQGVWSRVAQAEPFTRLKRVQLENLIDGYRTRADEQKFTPGTGAKAAPPSATP
jgi:chromosome segregation ATPase